MSPEKGQCWTSLGERGREREEKKSSKPIHKENSERVQKTVIWAQRKADSSKSSFRPSGWRVRRLYIQAASFLSRRLWMSPPLRGSVTFSIPVYLNCATVCPFLLKCCAIGLLGLFNLILDRCSLIRVFRALLVWPTYDRPQGQVSRYMTFVVEQVMVPLILMFLPVCGCLKYSHLEVKLHWAHAPHLKLPFGLLSKNVCVAWGLWSDLTNQDLMLGALLKTT